MATARTISTIQDVMRGDVGLDGDAQRIGQLAWMLFLKIVDEQERQQRRTSKRYRSPIPERYRWRSWATRVHPLKGEHLLRFVNKQLFPYLRGLSKRKNDQLSCLISNVFRDTHNYMRSATLLRRVIDKLNEELDFGSPSEAHVFGEIYELLLRELQSAGNAGEFYTPRAVTQFMAEMVKPRLGETVLDPACGTGGFLTAAIDHIRATSAVRPNLFDVLEGSIRGVEKKPLPYILCVTNMLLHGLPTPYKIQHDNLLTRKPQTFGTDSQVDIVLTNPPFGGIEEAGVQDNFPHQFRTRETADLFLALIISLLRSSGRAAVILPDGFLFGDGVKSRLRQTLLHECNLHTIVRLPSGVFSPYTNIRTNLLFFDRKGPTSGVWFYEHRNPKPGKSYTKTNPILSRDFEPERLWWNSRLEDENAWYVSLESIRAADYNLDLRHPERSRILAVRNSHEVLNAHVSITSRLRSHISALQSALEATDPTARHPGALPGLLKELPTILTTPSGPSQLRDLILGLAFRGRLVQELADGYTGQQAVEAIASRGFTSRQTSFAFPTQDLFIDPSKAPFEIPDTWVWTRLSLLGRIVAGGTPNTRQPEYFALDGIPWLTPADLYNFKEKTIIRGRRDITQLGLENSSAQLVPPGTVLFSSRAPIGYVAIAGGPLATNQGFKSCIPHRPEMSEYIYYYLRSAAKEIDRMASGTTFKEIPGREFAKIPIPIPSIIQQQRIVSTLDILFSQCDELDEFLKEHRTHSEALVKALMYEALYERSNADNITGS